MKKRARTDYQVGDALSDAVKDEEAFNSIIYALEADPMILLFRLRAGIASNAEQALAADLIEGKKKPKKGVKLSALGAAGIETKRRLHRLVRDRVEREMTIRTFHLAMPS